MVLVEELAGVEEAVAVARDLSKILNLPVTVEGHEVATTASVGIAYAGGTAETADDLLRHADAAMYAAKELGRDRIEVFDDTLRMKVRRRLQNEIELRQAVENDELVVHYQPEMAVPSGEVLGVEALIRWQHPTRGLMAPDDFIPAAETGLIVRSAAGCCARPAGSRWLAGARPTSTPVRVNLSARQFPSAGLLETSRRTWAAAAWTRPR